ncbi:MAG TPA: TOMM system kinase/cyclase fusion protein, partial [Polyangiaceae bacterium]|nr:TOMM system kinase/cyclase fusion protein [Polyangiaceae bacterium]
MTELVLPEDTEASTTDRLRALGYDVQHGIGSGAGGAVYKALQRSTGQSVAVKVLTLGDMEPDVRVRRIERFRREIAFCSSLYHPDIVRLLDSGELEEGHRFAVFEYIPGRTLAELLRDEGMLTVARARNLLSQLLPPLAYAHAKGIAHRDLKPGNVMVTSDVGRDRIKILDFGISISTARESAELVRLTQSHEWVGTPVYAAPEQLRGEPTGAKSDLYAWALMFVEALTGATLVGGKSLAEIIAKQFKPEPHVLPAPLAQHRLGALLLRALEKDPARRLGDAEQVQSLLERISTEGLEDSHGYLREAAPVSAEFRSRRSPTDTVTDARLPEHTEQRRVTALCCRVRLVGTGALSHVEQIDALLDDSQGLISEILQQFGATAASAMAGYSLWYFGLSQARDADARLAVRAALEIVNRIKQLPSWFAETGLSLAVQIGVHNGPVTVRLVEGRKVPVDGLTARLALDLASCAARASATAEPSAVLVSEEFRELVARSADLELYEAAGEEFTTTVGKRQIFRLAGESRSTSVRLERPPFVGRSLELEALTTIWRRTGSGEGTVVLLSGEPGIGKSRLAAELMLRLEQEGCRSLEIRCLPEWQNASLRPVQGLMQHLLGVAGAASDSGSSLEQKVRELGLAPATAVPLFCVWLSVSMPPGFAPLTWSPQKQRQLLHELVVEALLVTLERGSVLLVEDIHWADPSTLELLDLLAGKVKSRSALAILTTRPEKSLTWSSPVEALSLAGLDDTAVRALATALLPDASAGHVNLAQFVARSDGIPLYVEELAIALRQKQRVPEGSSTASSGGTHGNFDGVPASLRDLLTSRLDEIGEGRRTAQFAAALGREFSLELLTALDTRDEFALASDLEELVTAQILAKRLRLGSPVYIFRHALIRDAAYDSMQPTARERTHEAIGLGLESRFPALAASEPDVLAHHFDRARQGAKAVHYWQLAAQKSSFASAHLEAMAQIDRALELLREAPSTPEAVVTESQILLTRGAIIVGKRGYTDLEAKGCFERIASLVKPEGSGMPLAFAARWGLWYFNNTRANLRESCGIANELSALARAAGDSAMSLTASTALCQSRFCTGQLA